MNNITQCIQFLNSMDIVLATSLIISVIVNAYLYIQVKRYQNDDNTTKANWQDVMGLNDPLRSLLWIILIISFLITVPLVVFINL
ncbi:hypothetical protein [Bacillus solimangrovi]|uniref:Uncharacterized protein n=1 Tax=Bacillus solimangrovi TaxID=1305675 RepID=A0A1E5LE47_9BACI|nr:hypothetical protein [Bacillus solimangrovi]OEH92353.1 hypothetical protein BFG57_16390 [Bacillus solimangrovi]